jgi:hypothetical protein
MSSIEKLYYIVRETKREQNWDDEFIKVSDKVWSDFFFLHPFLAEEDLEKAQRVVSAFESQCHSFATTTNKDLERLVKAKDELFHFFRRVLFGEGKVGRLSERVDVFSPTWQGRFHSPILMLGLDLGVYPTGSRVVPPVFAVPGQSP